MSNMPDLKIQVGKELKCRAHARMLDSYEYFSYSLPQTLLSGKLPKKKTNEGFTQKHFEEMEKKSLPQSKVLSSH